MSSILKVDEIQSVNGNTVLASSGELLSSDVPVTFPKYSTELIPESIETGEVFYDTSLNLLCYWDGTQSVPISYYDAGIVGDGLCMHLDAGNRQSINGLNDFLWKDLSPHKLHANVIGTNYWTSSTEGFFNYPGGDQTADWVLMPKEAARLTEGYYTIETWLRPNDPGTGARYWNSFASSATDNVKISNQVGASIGAYQGSDFSITNGTWYQYVERRQGSDSGHQFLNGGNKQSSAAINDIQSTEGWVLNQEQDSVLGGFAATQAPNIDFAIVRLYNRALTDAEILQNFEAQRDRFGI